ncbi:glycosyltransferase family 2 protein [Parabacteroides distasonis]|uniref:glycosyltransferase family 2 protein n=1 Tax=Parabacteroides distasonis TaxID=823 RepID=UPI001F336B57|nr:glycosyltransferase family 2 protein [Parabacteroides distasonis]MCE9059216.1 glycosyltransferase family 2 protein [Parabacteroides distasonis]
MLDLSVIILTYNEEIHIRRCLENVKQFASKVYVVDCFSIDRTAQIAKELGAEVIEHEWPGNQAEQFNWALDNLPITTEWILRLDADEYLLPGLIEELLEKLPVIPESVSALSLSLARAFCGKILHHGIVNNIRIIRIFRKGKARYEKRLMDEHLSVLSGETIDMKNQFVDDNRMPIGLFIDKHNGYATREAALLLDAEYHLTNMDSLPQDYGREVEKKRTQKARYARMPLFWRAFGYFVYRYIINLGFLDGKEGFLWDFLQGWWYRTLVDAKVYEIKKACGDDKEKMRHFLQDKYNITL